MPLSLYRRVGTLVHFEQEVGVGSWAVVDFFGEEKDVLLLPGVESRAVQSAAWSVYRLRYAGCLKEFTQTACSFPKRKFNVLRNK